MENKIYNRISTILQNHNTSIKMKQLILHLFFLLSIVFCNAQSDTLSDDFPSNSFEVTFKNRKTNIEYKYIDSTQTHDYSGNWDFDLDGKTDALYFIGNGGAHLYFNLQIILSSNGKTQNFPFLLLDIPLVEEIDYLKEQKFYPPPIFPQFVVDDFDADIQDEIFINVYKSTLDIIKDDLKAYDVTSRYILIDFKDGQIELSNFMHY